MVEKENKKKGVVQLNLLIAFVTCTEYRTEIFLYMPHIRVYSTAQVYRSILLN